MRDGRGIVRFFIALFAALGSLIIPKREKEAVKKESGDKINNPFLKIPQ